MGLKESLSDLASEMDRYTGCSDVKELQSHIYAWSMALRILSKSLIDTPKIVESDLARVEGVYSIPESVKMAMERNQQKVFQSARKLDLEEKIVAEGGEVIVLFEGGCMDGTYAPIQGQPPEGAKTRVSGHSYIFKGGKFHYTP